MTTATPAQVGSPFQQLMRLYHQVTPVFEQEVGVSLARWRVLALLFQSERLSQSYLQQRLQIDPAAVTRQVKQLEEEGIVTRWANPEDNRSTFVALTEHGQEMVASLYERRQMFEQAAMRGIDAEAIAVLERCLEQIRNNVSTLASENL